MGLASTLRALLGRSPSAGSAGSESLCLTRAAADELRLIAREHAPANWHLHVSIASDPNTKDGFRYNLDVNDDPLQPGDIVRTLEGIEVRIDGRSAPYLAGVEIDFRQDASGKGFVFRNPKAMKKS